MNFKLTIRKKITMAMVAVVLFSVSILVAFTFSEFEDTIAEATKKHLMDQVENKASIILSLLDTYNTNLETFTQNQSVVTALENGVIGKYDDVLQHILSNSENNKLTDIVLLDNAGNILATTNKEYENIDYSKDIAVQKVLSKKSETVQSGVLNAETGDEQIMTIIAINKDNKLIGALVGYISYEAFDEEMKASFVSGIDNLASYIMDETGIIFGHTEPNKIGTMVQNKVILDVVTRLDNGETIEKDGVIYEYKGEMKFAGYYVIPNNHWIVCMSVSEDEIIGPIKKKEHTTYLLIIILCIFICILAILLSGIITKPIIVTNKTLNEIANLDFQLSENYRNFANKKDETGEMCAAICSVADNLREELLLINEVSNNLEENGEHMQEIALSMKKNTESNLSIISDISNSFNISVSTTDSMTNKINNVMNCTNEMNQKVEESVKLTNQLMERAKNLKDITKAADKKSSNIFDEVKKAMDEAIEQSKSVEKISMFTDSIMSIASQTKLLSLNASIEAARAGEAGKGFAVVAEEISELAKQTSESTDNITGLVNEIYQAVYGLEDCLKRSLSYLEEQVIPDYKQFSDASEAYNEDAGLLSGTIDFLQDGISEFSETMQDTVSSIMQIGDNINQSASNVHNMKLDNESTAELVIQTYDMITENSRLSAELKKAVNKYKL